MRDTITVGV
jgi:hypothetical protein